LSDAPTPTRVKLPSLPNGSSQEHPPQVREIQEFRDSKIARKG
jgi:hypothetical protein